MKKFKQPLKGFTIIEVMIVLAVAGLIILIVLIAAPALTRNAHNSARKDLTNRIKTELDNYGSNNQGQVPTTAANITTFNGQYLTGNPFKDPETGSAITLTYQPTVATVPTTPGGSTTQVVYYHNGDVCGGAASVTGVGTTGASARNYAIWTALDGGALYCVDNK